MMAEVAQLLTILPTITPNHLAQRLSLIGSHLAQDDWSGLLYGIEEVAQNGRAALAEQLMTVCLQIAHENENEWAVRAITYFLGHVYFHQGKMAQAIETYQTVVELGQESPDEDGLLQAALALGSIGRIYLEQGHIPQAIAVREASLALERQFGQQTSAVSSRLQIAGLYLVQEDFALAEATLRQALLEAQEIDNPLLIALTWMRLGNLQLDLENPAQALEYYQIVMEALDAIEEPEDDELHLMAYRDLYVNLGSAQQEQGEFDQAIAAYSSAARLAYALEDKRSQAVAITWLGSAQLDVGRPQLALRSFNAAERLTSLVGYADWQGIIYFFRALAWQTLGRFAQAQAFAHQAIQFQRAAPGENSPNEVGCWVILGEIALEKGDFQVAVTRYQQALHILREVDVGQMHRIIYLRLGEAYWYLGEFTRAYEMLRQALAVYESKRQTVSELWARVDFAPARDQVYDYLVLTCLALGKMVEAFTVAEEGRMRVFREQLAAQPVMHEPVETLDWSDIRLLMFLNNS